jgi:ketosteroid isomerase-like protein
MLAPILMLAAALAASNEADDAPPSDPVIAAVRAQDDALAAAHGRGDMDTYRAGLSTHYAYIDIGGKRVDADTLSERREADQRRVISTESLEEEAVKLTDTAVLLRGLERTHATYYDGLPRRGESRWSALWVKEDDGIWRLAAETATPVRTTEQLPFQVAPQPRATHDTHAGAWTLATTPPIVLRLRATDDGLVGGIDGQSAQWTFSPASATHYFAAERPFELRFAADADRLDMVTWGTSTPASRAAK